MKTITATASKTVLDEGQRSIMLTSGKRTARTNSKKTIGDTEAAGRRNEIFGRGNNLNESL